LRRTIFVSHAGEAGAAIELVKGQQTFSRDTEGAIGRLMLNLPGVFAEFEHPSSENVSE
jgi:DNA invertase Pin-like site-specific DNA recombinase